MRLTTTLATLALATFGLSSCQNGHQGGQTTTAISGIPDEYKENFIPADSANKMIESYLVSIGDSGSSSNDSNLQSLILDAGSVRAYLADTSITKVKIMFAHTLQYINTGHGGQPAGYMPGRLTLILAGYNAAGNYVLAPGWMVPDHAEPCPTSCSLTGTSASPLLPTAN